MWDSGNFVKVGTGSLMPRVEFGMDGSQVVLELIRDHQLAVGRLRGFFHLLIGRKLSREDGAVLSMGLTWRELATALKQLKFDRELVKELGSDPESVSPKDREKFWYFAIGLAKVDSAQARREAEELTLLLKPLGIVVGIPPAGPPKPAPVRVEVVEVTTPAATKRKKK